MLTFLFNACLTGVEGEQEGGNEVEGSEEARNEGKGETKWREGKRKKRKSLSKVTRVKCSKEDKMK